MILLPFARGSPERTVGGRGSRVERQHPNVLCQRRKMPPFTLWVCRNCHTVFQFGKRDSRHDHVAEIAFLKTPSNLLGLIFHQVNADVRVEHIKRHNKSSRSVCSCSSRPSTVKSGPNFAKLFTTPPTPPLPAQIPHSPPPRP